MIRTYFITTLRHLSRQRFYSLINISGLALGLACFLLMFLYIRDELSYDRYHGKGERIYRVIDKIDTEGQGEESSSCPFPLGPSLQNDYPEMIEKMVRFFNFQEPSHTFQYKDLKFNETKSFLADSTVFEIFDFPLEKGDRNTVLDQPGSVVISKSIAQKYFGEDEPVGKILRFDGNTDLMVTGVLGDIPSQQHFHFNILISFSTLNKIYGTGYIKNWVWNPCWTYILLKEGIEPEQLKKHFPEFIPKYFPPFISSQTILNLQPLYDIHLHSDYDYEIEPNSDYSYLYIFGAIGIFILIIACINYMNLTTARSARRARETGIRKVSGATSGQLIVQFLLESYVICFFAILLSLALCEIILPVFNYISEKNIHINYYGDWTLALVISILFIITGFISGIYPAFYLSSFHPAKILKSGSSGMQGNGTLRKSLVILQFSISLSLVICTFTIQDQIEYLQNADLGFTREEIIIIPVRPPMQKVYQPFMNEIENIPGVVSVTRMNEILGTHHNVHEYNYEGMPADKFIYYPSLMVDESFLQTFGIELRAGRNFSKSFPRDDSLGVLVNEAMVKHMNWGSPEQALGKQFYTPSGRERVIGVVKDFNFVSLKDPIGPFVFDIPHKAYRPMFTKFIAIRISGNNKLEIIRKLENTWYTFSEAFPFEYMFHSERLNNQYSAQENLVRLTGIFSLLAIGIACLGLFALASYTTELRTKEIGIRKVLGASLFQLVQIQSKQFLILIVISSLISFPVSWYLMDNWLKGFSYHTHQHVMSFLVPFVVMLIIALMTVLYHTLKSALARPVESLKYE